MGLFDQLKRSPKTPDSPQRGAWEDSEEWRHWSSPWNAVRDEELFDASFRKLVGRRRPSGYCTPVEVTLVPEDDGSANFRAEIAGLKCGRLDSALASRIAERVGGPIIVPGVVRGGFSRRGDRPAGGWGVHLWPWVLDPPGVDLSGVSFEYVVPAWPPKVHQGRDYCPECGLFRNMREVRERLVECTECKVQWSPTRERLLPAPT